jgi:hypothetical protein
MPTLSKSVSESRFINSKHLDHLNLTYSQNVTASTNGSQKRVAFNGGSQKNHKIFNTRKLNRRCKSETENTQSGASFFKKYIRQNQNKLRRKSGDMPQIEMKPFMAKLNNRRGVLVKKNSISLDCLYNNNKSAESCQSYANFSTIPEGPNDFEEIFLHVPHRKNVRSHSTVGLKIETSSKKWIKELGSRAHLKIKKNIVNLINKESIYDVNDATFFSRSMHFLNKDSIIVKKQTLKQPDKKDKDAASNEKVVGATRKEFLSAPKARRVRSNSPLVQNGVHQPNNYLTITNHHSHQKSTSVDKSSMRSTCGSTNSTFSAGFLPSPEMNSPSATSLFNGYDSQTNSSANTNSNGCDGHKKDTFSTEQHEQLKTKLIREQRRLSLKSKFHKTTPVKIMVQEDENVNEAEKVNAHREVEIKSVNEEEVRKENLSKTSVDSAEIAEENEQIRELKTKAEIEKESKIKSIQELGSTKNNSMIGPKPGQEVLTLISTWIKNAPNDFMGMQMNI